MCDKGGFDGWKGKWKKSASSIGLFFVLSIPVVLFSCATRSLALISALARSGRMDVGE